MTAGARILRTTGMALADTMRVRLYHLPEVLLNRENSPLSMLTSFDVLVFSDPCAKCRHNFLKCVYEPRDAPACKSCVKRKFDCKPYQRKARSAAVKQRSKYVQSAPSHYEISWTIVVLQTTRMVAPACPYIPEEPVEYREYALLSMLTSFDMLLFSGACARCKKLVKRCIFETPYAPACKTCVKHNKRCEIPERRPRGGSRR